MHIKTILIICFIINGTILLSQIPKIPFTGSYTHKGIEIKPGVILKSTSPADRSDNYVSIFEGDLNSRASEKYRINNENYDTRFADWEIKKLLQDENGKVYAYFRGAMIKFYSPIEQAMELEELITQDDYSRYQRIKNVYEDIVYKTQFLDHINLLFSSFYVADATSQWILSTTYLLNIRRNKYEEALNNEFRRKELLESYYSELYKPEVLKLDEGRLAIKYRFELGKYDFDKNHFEIISTNFNTSSETFEYDNPFSNDKKVKIALEINSIEIPTTVPMAKKKAELLVNNILHSTQSRDLIAYAVVKPVTFKKMEEFEYTIIYKIEGIHFYESSASLGNKYPLYSIYYN